MLKNDQLEKLNEYAELIYSENKKYNLTGLKNIEGAPKYSRFINQLKVKNISLDRKILAGLVVNDFNTFQEIVTFSSS